MSIDLFTPWRESITMVAFLRKADVLFAVSVLSDRYFDNDKGRRAYAEVIGDYFAEVGMKPKRIWHMKIFMVCVS